LLADVKGEGKRVEETGFGERRWTVVYNDKVAIALNKDWGARWRKGGSKTERSSDGRSMALDIPPRGWRKGYRLVAVYAPTSKQRVSVAERMRAGVEKLLRGRKPDALLVMGGDWNAQVGAGKDRAWKEVLGPHGDARRTERGETLLGFCEANGLSIANTFCAQKDKTTWTNPYWGTRHAIDHMMVQRKGLMMVNKVITLHKEVAMDQKLEHWGLYTDHDPVEMTMREGRDWAREASGKGEGIGRADMDKVRGQTAQAKEWKAKFEKEVTERLDERKASQGRKVEWPEVASILRKAAVKVLGPEPKRDTSQWLRTRMNERKRLGEVVAFMRERCNSLRARARRGEGNLRERIRKAEKMKKESEGLRRKAERKWANNWWIDLADEAEAAEKIGDARMGGGGEATPQGSQAEAEEREAGDEAVAQTQLDEETQREGDRIAAEMLETARRVVAAD